MPELPEVETVMRGLAAVMIGARFERVEQRRPDLRFPLPNQFVARLTGQRVRALSRRAKYILVWLESGEVLVLHLGMSGRFRVDAAGSAERPGGFSHAAGRLPAHDHIVFHMTNDAVVTFNDARRFGFMDLVREDEVGTHKLFRDLGPEPLSNSFNAEVLAKAARGRAVDLKALLMDQRTVAGLGNIYVSEALWRAGLRPSRLAATLAGRLPARARAEALVIAIREVLSDAIAAGGSSLRDHRRVDGELGYFQKAHAVYDRAGEPCRRAGCTGHVKRIVQGQRSTFFCPSCQR